MEEQESQSCQAHTRFSVISEIHSVSNVSGSIFIEHSLSVHMYMNCFFVVVFNVFCFVVLKSIDLCNELGISFLQTTLETHVLFLLIDPLHTVLLARLLLGYFSVL